MQDLELSDGMVYAAGLTEELVSPSDAYLLRTTADGTVDESFGSGGVATWKIRATNPGGLDVDVLPRGGLIASYQIKGHLLVRRLTAQGLPNSSFSDDGKLSLQIETPAGPDGIAPLTEVAIDHHGRILVAAQSHVADSPRRHVNVRLWRLHPSGEIDQSFSNDGFRNVDVTISDAIRDLTVDSDNRPIVATASTNRSGSTSTYITRLQHDGGTDATYSNDGVVRVALTGPRGDDTMPLAAAMKGDALTVALASRSEGIFGSARILDDGTPDPSYGIRGLVGFSCHCDMSSADVDEGVVAFAGDAGRDQQILARVSTAGQRIRQSLLDLLPNTEYEYVQSLQISGDVVILGGRVFDFTKPRAPFIAQLQ